MDFKINNILVPTDYSASANIALNVAIEMAKRHSATIHLLNIVEPMVFGKFVHVGGAVINIQKEMLKLSVSNMIMHETSITNNTILKVVSNVEVGLVDSIIEDYEKKNNIDITIIGTHGITGYDEAILGSTAMTIIKKSSCPVLSIPPFFGKTSFKSILFPVRFVEGIEEKYDYVKPIIKKNEASIHLLGVFEPENNEEIYPITEELQNIKRKIDSSGYVVSYQVLSSTDIEKTILETANNKNFDLIIINATLDKKWYHLFSGNSFTHNIVTHSKTPVLSIKPGITQETIDNALKVVYSRAQHYQPLNLPNTN
ncbi:MAG: universal stress protein [Flavobacterium sp.]|uniref:universal stress protein n=1 Tax=Flavobacterium sp. TaxID=239 RepID=UPI003264D30B